MKLLGAFLFALFVSQAALADTVPRCPRNTPIPDGLTCCLVRDVNGVCLFYVPYPPTTEGVAPQQKSQK